MGVQMDQAFVVNGASCWDDVGSDEYRLPSHRNECVETCGEIEWTIPVKLIGGSDRGT